MPNSKTIDLCCELSGLGSISSAYTQYLILNVTTCECHQFLIHCTCILVDEECMLCDNLVNCQFIPCGHTVMCMDCGKRTKKCPQCKVRDG